MANKKISALGPLATPADGDILPITDIDDSTGSPQGTTKGVTVANLMGASPVQSVAGRTGAVIIDNADVSGLGTAALKDVGTSNGNVVELDATGLPAVDGSQLTNLPSPDVNGPLNTALRGTDNPHIGAFPNQSFKVIDNPKKLVMVIATDSGDLDFLLPDGGSIFLNTPSGGRLAPGFGFSVQEDATEPDIEVQGTLAGASENYSVISGDSDTKANGLPLRQGFNLPDIGANPSPILISGGSIA